MLIHIASETLDEQARRVLRNSLCAGRVFHDCSLKSLGECEVKIQIRKENCFKCSLWLIRKKLKGIRTWLCFETLPLKTKTKSMLMAVLRLDAFMQSWFPDSEHLKGSPFVVGILYGLRLNLILNLAS